MTVGVEPRYTDTKSKYKKNFRKSLDAVGRVRRPLNADWHMEVLKSLGGDPARHWNACRRYDGHLSLGDTYAVGMIVLIRKDTTSAWQNATIAELGFGGSHKKRPLRFHIPGQYLNYQGWVSLQDVRILPTCLPTDINDLSTGRLCMDIDFGVAYLAVHQEFSGLY